MRAPAPRLLAAALLAGAMPAAALGAQPAGPPVLAPLEPGVKRLTPHAYLYVPKATAAPAPLIVLLHGAGGDARSFLDEFRADADRRGALLLSLQSTGRSWPQRAPAKGEPDVDNMLAALEALGAGATIDPERSLVMGFSDGASHALSLGLAFPRLFRTVVALSPGYAFAPAKPDTSQRIFIAHGRRDPVLPPGNVEAMAGELERAGYRPQLRWFAGGHVIDRRAVREALDLALGSAG